MRRRKQRSRGQGSLKKRTKHGPYIARWIDHEGRRRERSTRTTDRAAAERILAKLIADVALRRDGVIDPHLDATLNETRRDIADHIADFEARLIAAHRKPKHVAQTIRYIRTIVDAKGWTCAADINADGVNGFAADLRTLGERGRSARTIQAHLTAIKGFTKWLSAHHKLPRDPLVSVTKPKPEGRSAARAAHVASGRMGMAAGEARDRCRAVQGARPRADALICDRNPNRTAGRRITRPEARAVVP
jgi:hypothetical protein